MTHLRFCALNIVFMTLACFAGLSVNSSALIQMASTSATFFSAGIQQRLELAIRANDSTAVAQLLSTGAKVDARGKHEVTPLMIAVDAQVPDALAALLRGAGNPNLKAADGSSPVSLATENHAVQPKGHDILAMIMANGGDPNTLRPDSDPVIARFIYDHDLDDLRWFKSLGANIDIIGRGNRPLIVNVAFAQNWDSVWCLIELGARYDYEHSLYSLSEALDSRYPSPDSPLYPYKLKVWQLLKEKGLPVKPMKP